MGVYGAQSQMGMIFAKTQNLNYQKAQNAYRHQQTCNKEKYQGKLSPLVMSIDRCSYMREIRSE
jgi:hypothetical protein